MIRHIGERAPSTRSAQVSANDVDSCEDSGHIPVEDCQRRVIRDAQDGGRGVRADSGKLERDIESTGKLAAVIRDDFFRSDMQVARATVVAEAGPKFQNFLLW